MTWEQELPTPLVHPLPHLSLSSLIYTKTIKGDIHRLSFMRSFRLLLIKIPSLGDLPGGLVVKSLSSKEEDVGLIPGWGAKILHASWHKKNQNIKQARCCNKFNKDFKNGPHKKKILKKISYSEPPLLHKCSFSFLYHT